jgi:hypothetical protein
VVLAAKKGLETDMNRRLFSPTSFFMATAVLAGLTACASPEAEVRATLAAMAKTLTAMNQPPEASTSESAPTVNTDTPAPEPSETAAFTSTISPILFGQAVFSTQQLWQGGESCKPQNMKVEVQVTPAEMVSSVGFFFRIVAKSGDHSVPWGGGWAMLPQGGGWYQLAFEGNDLPDVDDWWEDAWLDFQFVANDSNNQTLARSEVIRSVTLSQCYV